MLEETLETIKAYVALTKPRVIELLLVATIPAMLQAERGENNIGLILLTLLGGWMELQLPTHSTWLLTRISTKRWDVRELVH